MFLAILFIASAFGADYINPIISAQDLPDPGVYVDNETNIYYIATTTVDNSQTDKYPIHTSSDLINWKYIGTIFTPSNQPTWAVMDFWAPEIHKIGNQFVVYFAARNTNGVLCVGAAYSNAVTGPYTDIGQPLVSNATMGMIDPTFFYDQESGNNYLFWKEDGNGHNPPVRCVIWAQQLSADGLSLVGEKTSIIENDFNSWEYNIVEAPWVIKPQNSSFYYLFYSGNFFITPFYAVGVARSENILGPWEKYEYNPILHNNTAFDGPGHCSVVQDAVESSYYIIFYHSWIHNEIANGYPRLLMMDSIVWMDGWPTLHTSSPSIGPQPTPPVPSRDDL